MTTITVEKRNGLYRLIDENDEELDVPGFTFERRAQAAADNFNRATERPEPVYGKYHMDEDGQQVCCNPEGHSWAFTGTQYGGDDERWHGEGRALCEYCGADGDA